jgi:uncharacterized membrane protein
MSSHNPYEAPQAAVADYVAPDAAGAFLAEPRKCELGASVRWLSEGWSYFMQSPGIWVGICALWFVFVLATQLVPIIGPIVGNLLMPVLIAGIVLGCDALRRGEPLTVAHLFAGFNQNAAQLILIGALNLAATFAIMLVVFVPFFGFAGFSVLSGTATSDQMQGMQLVLLLAVLVMVALLLPLIMAMWFAPALAVLNDLGGVDAMKRSFFACLKNFWPYVIYGLIGFPLAIAATIPLGLGWLVLAPVFMAAMYASYRDIFYAD